MAQTDDVGFDLGLSLINGLLKARANKESREDNQQHELDKIALADSLKGIKDKQNIVMADSLQRAGSKENLMLEDSLNTEGIKLADRLAGDRQTVRDSTLNEYNVSNREDTQKFQKGNQAISILTAMLPQMANTKNEEIDISIMEGQDKYDQIRSKVGQLEEAKRQMYNWTPNLKKLNKQTLQFRTEKGFPFSESDMLTDYENSRDEIEGTVIEALKLPMNNRKRTSVKDFIDTMVKRANHKDFLDGDWGFFGGDDPDGGQAKAIKEELEIWQDLLSDEKGSARFLDDMYGITPEERLFYQTWGRQKSGFRGNKILNTQKAEAELKEQLDTLIEQSQ